MGCILFCSQIAFTSSERGALKCEVLLHTRMCETDGFTWHLPGLRAKPLLLPPPEALISYAEIGTLAIQSISPPDKYIIPSKPRALASELLQPFLFAYSPGMVCHRQPHSLPFYRHALHLAPAWQFIQCGELVFFTLNSHWMCPGACTHIRCLTKCCAFIFLFLCHQYCRPLWPQDLCRHILKLLTFIACLLCAKHSAMCFIHTFSNPYKVQSKFSILKGQLRAMPSLQPQLFLSLSHTNQFPRLPSCCSTKITFSGVAHNSHVTRSDGYPLELILLDLRVSDQADHPSSLKHSAFSCWTARCWFSFYLLTPLTTLPQTLHGLRKKFWRKTAGFLP